MLKLLKKTGNKKENIRLLAGSADRIVDIPPNYNHAGLHENPKQVSKNERLAPGGEFIHLRVRFPPAVWPRLLLYNEYVRSFYRPAGGMIVRSDVVMIDLFPVKSSVIAAAGFDPQRRILLVLYNTGRAYEYHSVPSEVFQGLIESESKGKYLNDQILGTFPYKLFRGWEGMEDESTLRTGRTRKRASVKTQ